MTEPLDNDSIVDVISRNNIKAESLKKYATFFERKTSSKERDFEYIKPGSDSTVEQCSLDTINANFAAAKTLKEYCGVYNCLTHHVRASEFMYQLNGFYILMKDMADKIMEVLESQDSPMKRLLPLDYGFDISFAYTTDLCTFMKRVNGLFTWFDKADDKPESKKECNKYKAPYFPMIQSSGTGKTRLLVELCKAYNKEAEAIRNNNESDVYTACHLVLCQNNQSSQNEASSLFKLKWNTDALDNKSDEVDSVKDTNNKIFRRLAAYDKWIDDCVTKIVRDELRKNKKACKKLVLLFDEAQHLTKNDDGLAFRVVRWYLRKSRTDSLHIVAVFSGTTSNLSNFYNDKKSRGDSRYPEQGYYNYDVNEKDDVRDEKERKKMLYNPFYELTTMACLCSGSSVERVGSNNAGNIGGNNDSVHTNASNLSRIIYSANLEEGYNTNTTNQDELDVEWKLAARFGRPLFAAKQLHGGFSDISKRVVGGVDVLYAIALRMLLLPRDTANWKDRTSALYSVLGTRVQLGIVHNHAMASELVESAYANLVDFMQIRNGDESGFFTGISFPPDPVLAWLAMRMMHPSGFTSADGKTQLKGEDKAFWSNAAASMFSSRLCLPEKGDYGEVMAALLLLFSADELRHGQKKNMSKFSVSMDQWYTKLLKRASGSEVATAEESMQVDEEKAKQDGEACEYKVEVNFIQVCRNYLRDQLWRDEDYLQGMYHSAVAYYAYPQCECVDMFFAIRVPKSDMVGSEKPKQANVEAKQSEELKNDPYQYHAVLVSVKNQQRMSEKDMNTCEVKMLEYAKSNNHERAVLCILLVFLGTPKKSRSRAAATMSTPSLPSNFPKETASCRVVVQNDSYGLCNALKKGSLSSEKAEVLTSYSRLQGKFDKQEQTAQAAEYARKMFRSTFNKENFELLQSVLRGKG